MKKLITLFIIFFISITATPISPCSAEPQATYAMVITDEAYLFADAGGVVIKYILPKSYFVFVKESFGELARVAAMQGFQDCPEVEGYVKLVDLKFYKEKPVDPYLNLNLTSCYDEVLFSDNQAQKPKTVLTKGSNAKLYGEYVLNNQKYYYVYANGYIGYVRQNAFDNPAIPLHAEYIKLIEEPKPEESAKENSSYNNSQSSIDKENDFSTTNIIVIALILICGLCVLYFIFKPEKLGHRSIYKDDE